MSIARGYIMPHPPILISEVGSGDQYKALDTLRAMDKAAKEIAKIKPKTIIVISPHGPLFSDAVTIRDDKVLCGDFGSFGAEGVRIRKENDTDITEDIIIEAMENGISIARIDDNLKKRFNIDKNLDHGVLVPLYFIDKEYSNYKLVSINYGLLSSTELYRFGMCIKNVIEHSSKDIVVIASGDLSHKLKDDGPYRYSDKGVRFDKEYQELLINKEFIKAINFDHGLCEEAGECGKRSIDILLGIFDGYQVSVERFSYEFPFGVGYSVYRFDDIVRDQNRKIYENILLERDKSIKKLQENEDQYVKLARASLESYIKNNKKLSLASGFPEELYVDKAGVFVSIKNENGLRGCIGTTGPTCKNIGEEIIENAIKASTEDHRFDPIEEDELGGLIINVDVLSKPVPISDLSELDPKVYGVIVESGYKRGLLLPDLEGIDTIEEQLRIALNKGGINPQDEYDIYRFTVERHR